MFISEIHLTENLRETLRKCSIRFGEREIFDDGTSCRKVSIDGAKIEEAIPIWYDLPDENDGEFITEFIRYARNEFVPVAFMEFWERYADEDLTIPDIIKDCKYINHRLHAVALILEHGFQPIYYDINTEEYITESRLKEIFEELKAEEPECYDYTYHQYVNACTGKDGQLERIIC